MATKGTIADSRRARVLGRGSGQARLKRLPLSTLRAAAGVTQSDVAQITGIDQGDISRLERRATFDDVQVSTLRRYLEAVGGRLELLAVFPRGHRVGIAPASEEPDE